MIANATRLGCSFKQACCFAGITEATGYNWRQRGRQDLSAGIKSPFVDFLTAYRRAWAEAEFELIIAIRRGMPRDWRAAAGFLEFRNPENWNLRRRVRQLEANPPWRRRHLESRPIDLRRLTPAERRQLKQLLREARHVKTVARCEATAASAAPCQNFSKQGKPFCSVHLGHARRLTTEDKVAMGRAVDLVGLGAGRMAACLLAGIQKEQARVWWELGETNKDASEVVSPYERFWWDLRAAEARAEMYALLWVRKATEVHFQAALWYLERRFPKHWCLVYRENRTPEELKWLDEH